MAASRLRIFREPESAEKAPAPTPGRQREITLSVSAVLPLLTDAVDSQRTWLEDFSDDEITISSDLYEVLLAYQYFQRPSA